VGNFKIRKDNLWFMSILILIITYPFNIKIISFLRITDILFLLFFFLVFFMGGLKINFLSSVILLFFICLFISSLWGIIFYEIKIEGFSFYYKYFSVFFLLWFILSAELSQRQCLALLKILGFSFIFLVFYTFYYHYILVPYARLPLRPDFLLSDIKYSTAGHLYGAYLSTGFSALLSYYLFFVKKHRILWVVMLLVSAIAVMLTGSRAAVIALAVGLPVLLAINFTKINIKSILCFSNILPVLIVIIAIVICQFYNFDFESRLNRYTRQVIERTFSFNINDRSYLSRIKKITFGVNQLTESSIIFGIGPQASPMWYDNSIMRLLIDTGVAGLLFFLFGVLIFLKNAYKMSVRKNKRFYFYILLISFIVYIINNLSTEFFLVTRSSFPFILLSGLLYKLIISSDISYKINS